MTNFPQDFTEKVTPVANDILLLADSADLDVDSNPKSDKKSKLSSLWTAIFGSRTTSDIPEGTDLYYTEERVNTNATVVALGADKAAKANVLELDNTTAYTPTLATHPATKGYVDTTLLPIAATDAQALALINTTNFITPSQLFQIRPGTTLLASLDTLDTTSSTVYVKVKEILLPKGGTYSTSFRLQPGGGGAGTFFGRIYVNGVAVGIERSISTVGSAVTFDEDIVVPFGGLLQLYIRATVGIGKASFLDVKYSTDPVIPFTINNN